MSSDLFDRIAQRLAGSVTDAAIAHGTPVLCFERDALTDVARALQDEFAFDLLLDVTAVDWPGRTPRFEVVWHLYSTQHKRRVRLKTRVGEDDPAVDTLTGRYGSAHFMERECHDMYGIVFRGNADLRPILLYEGFAGHPLRKDYPKRREQPLVPMRDGAAPDRE